MAILYHPHLEDKVIYSTNHRSEHYTKLQTKSLCSLIDSKIMEGVSREGGVSGHFQDFSLLSLGRPPVLSFTKSINMPYVQYMLSEATLVVHRTTAKVAIK